MLIKNDNPTKDEPERVANVSWDRLPQASFFNLMWKSIFVGIREIVGISIVPMKPAAQPGTSKKEVRQQKREDRKEAREQEREKTNVKKG